ncbi:MAG: DUF4854 domain-containing protein [Lachnospiraceae bacterium]|nr:DUF4854 domain-containing protein [Lachnospiraceae bacterium]
MKRKTLKMIACAAIMALTLSVTACGGDDAKTAESNDTETTADAAADDTEAATDDAADDAEAATDDTADDTEAATDDTADDTEAATDDAADDTDAAGDFQTLEDYYNDPTVKSALDAMFASVAEEGMSADLEVKGNEFTVIIKIEDSSMVVDGIAEALSAALDSQEETFKSQVKQFDDVIGQEGACTVIMRYTDPDDNVLAEKAFTAN